MSNFMIGCFILGAATVGLIHGQWGSLIGILAVLLWFTGLVRTGSNVLHQFLTLGAVSMTAANVTRGVTNRGNVLDRRARTSLTVTDEEISL